MNNTFQSIKVESHNKNIYSIILNRSQKKNALNTTLIIELTKAFNQLDEMNDCKVIILSSNSDCFCAGADLEELKTMQEKDEKTNVLIFSELQEQANTVEQKSSLNMSRQDSKQYCEGLIVKPSETRKREIKCSQKDSLNIRLAILI